MVPPFVTVLTFCVSQVWSEVLGFLSVIQRYFCAVHDYVGKADFSKGYQKYPKRKLDVTVFFLETIELKFGKKMSYVVLYFETLLSLKMHGYQHFSFLIPVTLLGSAF